MLQQNSKGANANVNFDIFDKEVDADANVDVDVDVNDDVGINDDVNIDINTHRPPEDGKKVKTPRWPEKNGASKRTLCIDWLHVSWLQRLS